MWNLIVRIRVSAGRRDQFIELLQQSAVGMPGCLSYVAAEDASDEATVWVTEVWRDEASHEASLSLPQVQAVIPRGKSMVSSFERIAVTSPVWAVGLTSHD